MGSIGGGLSLAKIGFLISANILVAIFSRLGVNQVGLLPKTTKQLEDEFLQTEGQIKERMEGMELNLEFLGVKVERLGTQVDEKMHSREDMMLNRIEKLRQPIENQMKQLRKQMEIISSQNIQLRKQIETLKNQRQN